MGAYELQHIRRTFEVDINSEPAGGTADGKGNYTSA